MRWPFIILGGTGLGLGIYALIQALGGWDDSVTEPEGDRDEENAMTTSGLLMWPVTGRVASPYGKRIHPITKKESFHNGIDIAIPAGTIVRAAADGVVKSNWDDQTYGGGYSLVISHTGPLSAYATGYAHLSDWLVTAGAHVKRGDPIALSGGVPGMRGAGMSTGAHLHLTVRKDGITVDPIGELEPAAPSIV